MVNKYISITDLISKKILGIKILNITLILGLCFFAFQFFKSHLIIILFGLFCAGTMIHKKYLQLPTLGIDFCLILLILISSKYGFKSGMIISLSFALGMIISLNFTKSPLMATYGTLFYILIGLIYSFVPFEFVIAVPVLHVIVINLIMLFAFINRWTYCHF